MRAIAILLAVVATIFASLHGVSAIIAVNAEPASSIDSASTHLNFQRRLRQTGDASDEERGNTWFSAKIAKLIEQRKINAMMTKLTKGKSKDEVSKVKQAFQDNVLDELKALVEKGFAPDSFKTALEKLRPGNKGGEDLVAYFTAYWDTFHKAKKLSGVRKQKKRVPHAADV
ncbi:secreted RxLR effector peptide protein, putative [Phytophthora infestans T30-4]|uniref:RxLR effector protein CRE7 n=2 Tax=Phytophthora infestans TaxID=4787 RepID=CRE7_PHYIT|nr:secreted RxLR effector peptide protein, putative [Phytophthora infestans T30-4]D0N9J3.1 RecName: Full=RxLR effector protein CRE7; AltName: Full=Core RXLR effector 7; Flags: Precursor [Phytophthora infestans T30-4]EEY54481.1 secreted RxLR effector peptide protein, putative [Phytophthora infestans T30-4]KAF4033706.1 hypothetical protein GN244_ATG14340 [Phytophthora infestans]KAF4146098.1 hypothetical protein GN958_ATG04764 [Phytophthora infestans]|eukprot:XP_002904303.1 secreted RxLR effector peptide protein, putative [Phytophthora infestans T30-4]